MKKKYLEKLQFFFFTLNYFYTNVIRKRIFRGSRHLECDFFFFLHCDHRPSAFVKKQKSQYRGDFEDIFFFYVVFEYIYKKNNGQKQFVNYAINKRRKAFEMRVSLLVL